ncbi:hypothetical protein D3C76_1332310 [compost metagenome]
MLDGGDDGVGDQAGVGAVLRDGPARTALEPADAVQPVVQPAPFKIGPRADQLVAAQRGVFSFAEADGGDHAVSLDTQFVLAVGAAEADRLDALAALDGLRNPAEVEGHLLAGRRAGAFLKVEQHVEARSLCRAE